MDKMVLLKCEYGSKAAIVLCPKCGRISRQILSVAFSPDQEAELFSAHTCPICASSFRECDASQAKRCFAAFTWYNRNAYEYNQFVAEKYLEKTDPQREPELRQEFESDQDIIWICGISFEGISGTFSYISNIGQIDLGKEVIVTAGETDITRIGIVKTCISTHKGDTLYSLNRNKRIIRLAAKEDKYNIGRSASQRYWVCGVGFDGSNRIYNYISDIGELEPGTKVLVPVGDRSRKIGIVKTCRNVTEEEAVYPIEMTKHIIQVVVNYDKQPYHSNESQSFVTDTRQTSMISNRDATDGTSSINEPEKIMSDSSNYMLQPIYSEDDVMPTPATVSNQVHEEATGTPLGEMIIPAPVSISSPEAGNEDLERKIDRWKRELLDTTKKNKMINFKETKRATLRILEPEASELFNKLAFYDKPLTFQKPINKDTDIRTYSMIALMETLSYTLNVQVGDIKTAGTIVEREKTLKNLRSKAKLAQEEQGTNILYLCFGFVYWREHDRESSPWMKAPLLMMPVTLGLKSLNAPYTLSRYDEEIEVNPTLDYLFNNEYNIDLPTFELKDKESFDAYIAEIESIVDKRGWKVTREVSLGLLSFLKISMYHDLNDHHDLMIKHPVLRAMAGDRAALGDLPVQADHFDFDAVKPDEWHEVVDADSSQEEAILLSKLGVSFVMQGPPGTGKSQTITNIIADALADGKKVLFVSEKAAALEVVLKRLTEVHLDDFCLSLHSHKANKKEIIDSIGANLRLEPETSTPGVLNDLAELFHDRKFLTKYAYDLHKVIEPLGESVYMIFGKLSKLEKASVISFKFDNPKSVSREQLSSLLYSLEALEKSLHNIPGTLDSNLWHGTTAKSSGQTFKQQLEQETNGLSDSLMTLVEKADAINKEYQTSIGHTWESLGLGIADMDRALRMALFPFWWTDESKLQVLLKGVQKEASSHALLSASMQRYQNVFQNSILDAPLNEWISRVEAIRNCYDSIGYTTDGDVGTPFTTALLNYDEVIRLLSDLKLLSEQYKSIAESHGLSKSDSLEYLVRASAVLELVRRRPRVVEKIWFTHAENSEALKLIVIAQDHSSKLSQARHVLGESWSEEVCNFNFKETHQALMKNRWIFSDSVKSVCIAELLASRLKTAQAIKNETIILTDTYKHALSVLGLVRGDTLKDVYAISRLINQISDIPYLETNWFDARKNDAVQPLLNEAVERYKIIEDLKASITKKWEREALDMEEEALAMLDRFKTEHVGVLHRLKSGYKEDIKKIRRLSREVGKNIDEEEAVAFLKLLKNLYDEKHWYSDHEEQLKEFAGSYYHGADTDWAAVKSGMSIAAGLANLFPYKNIPQSVILVAQQAASNIQSAAEINELGEILSEENIVKCGRSLLGADFIDFTVEKTSLAESVLPQVTDFMEQNIILQELISALQRYYLSTEGISAQAVEQLLYYVEQIQAEGGWFAENEDTLRSIYMGQYNGPDSNFDEIEDGLHYAKEVMTCFSDSVPEKLIDILCSEVCINPGDSDRITEKAITEITESVHTLTPFAFSENESLSESIIVRVSSWIHTTQLLADLSSEIRPCLISEDISIEQAVSFLNAAMQTKTMRDDILSQETDLAVQLGDRYQGIDTDWNKIETDIVTVSEYINAPKISVSQNFLGIICDREDLRLEAQKMLDGLRTVYNEAIAPYTAFAKHFDEKENIATTDLVCLSERVDKCINGFDELNRWLDYVEAKADCDAKGLGSFTTALVQKNNSISDVCAAFERGFYSQWLSEVIADVPAVQSFRRSVHEHRSKQFVKLDKKQYGIALKRIRERIINSFPNMHGVMKAGSELRILTHEMEKKKKIMPLRKLFQSIPHLLLTLKPCLMMSPLSVAYFLEANSYKFDIVIFDEASQIFPQDAVGAIYRAKQVVIAGDTKQLPPTNFFAASTSNNSEGYDDDEGYDDEVYDSILEETASVLPNRTLLWHYRSKHEHLIAFSNQEIYRNNLVTFPSSNESDPDTGVEFVHVPDGYYEASPKNYNIVEAQRCVQLVKVHIDKYPSRSLGIIAFSEKQQQAIALEIQKFREQNPEYEDFFSEGKEDEFFVKNLENVQGDERDTIFFSVGYAKTKEQKANGKPMAMRFGPLGVQGGERRLNVAITRAKINVKLVSSILPSDIDLSRTESDGIRMLRAYIEFAMNGEATLSAAHKVNRADDFVDSISQFIEEHGFKVRQYVGCSGYKIDIAVQHPSELIEEFVAGIECDGYSYASAKTARDRDRLRGTILKGMGWNLYRVWSTEWHKNPEIEGKRLLEFIKNAVAECDVKVKALEEEKRRIEDEKRLELEKARLAREEEERRKQQEREAEEAKRQEEIRAAERKRREENERKAAQQAAARKREEVRRKESKEKQQNTDLSWVKVGVQVRHERFGSGVVIAKEKDIIKVRFGRTERDLMYPGVIENGMLSLQVTEPTKATSEHPKAEVPNWAFVGAAVFHKYYGKGTIESMDGKYVSVKFTEDIKTFPLASVFTDRHLIQYTENSCEDAQANDKVPTETSGQISMFGRSILEDLQRKGFKCIDNRNASSILWVLYEPTKIAEFESIISEYGVKSMLEKRGAAATQNKPAWRIMFNN